MVNAELARLTTQAHARKQKQKIWLMVRGVSYMQTEEERWVCSVQVQILKKQINGERGKADVCHAFAVAVNTVICPLVKQAGTDHRSK